MTGMSTPAYAPERSRQLSTFFLGGLHFAVDVLTVHEVIRDPEVTGVPLSAPVVWGLINRRGQIVTAIDLRRRVGLPERPGDSLPVHLMVRVDGDGVSLVVDEIGDVLEVEEARFDPTPKAVPERVKAVITGTYTIDGHRLLVLDIPRAVTVDPAAHPGAG